MYKTIALLGCVLIFGGCKDLDISKISTSASSSISTSITKLPSVCPTSIHGSNVEWEVHFSPNGGAEEFIASNIRKAQNNVYLQGYSFTSTSIAEALVATNRFKPVEVILDKSDLTGKGSTIKILLDGKVPVYIDDKHAIAHNKIVLIDQSNTFTGSFNFTNAAEHRNAENSIKLVSPDIYKSYKQNYDLHKSHSYRLEHL